MWRGWRTFRRAPRISIREILQRIEAQASIHPCARRRPEIFRRFSADRVRRSFWITRSTALFSGQWIEVVDAAGARRGEIELHDVYGQHRDGRDRRSTPDCGLARSAGRHRRFPKPCILPTGFHPAKHRDSAHSVTTRIPGSEVHRVSRLLLDNIDHSKAVLDHDAAGRCADRRQSFGADDLMARGWRRRIDHD